MTYTITDTSSPLVQAIFLKAHCRLLAVGMNPPRGLTKREVLDKVSKITGNKYRRGDYGKAADDLHVFIRKST